jgi:hypothetical protein
MDERTYSEIRGRLKLTWSVRRLWRLAEELPREVVPVEDLHPERYQSSNPPQMPLDRLRRVLESDLRYPILLTADGRIMDGVHRLMKACLLGRQTVLAVRFHEYPEPDRVTTIPD